MSCWQTIQDYGLRSIGIGERLLPKTDFTICQHFTLIGSGLIWNIYFGVLALLVGFFIACTVAVGKTADPSPLAKRQNGLSSCFVAARCSSSSSLPTSCFSS